MRWLLQAGQVLCVIVWGMAAKKAKFILKYLFLLINFYILFAFFGVPFQLMIRSKYRLANILFYFPFTWYFLLFAAACITGYKWLVVRPKLPDTAYADIFPLLLNVAMVFVLTILAFALLSVLIAFLYILYNKNKKGIAFSIDTQPLQNAKGLQKQTIKLKINPILKPFLGFVKIRLQYDEGRYSKKFSLVEQAKKKLISSTIEGTYHWHLPEIKEYKVDKAVVYFEDFFQFFSLALPVVASNRFYTQPLDTTHNVLSASPRKTENTTTRIEELKRVEGEYINYKNFEGNDDVRRIVWKIYAKNKDLVVRIPEVLDPYASHIYMYASFFSDIEIAGNEVVEVPFLNFYKTIVWSAYRQLTQKGFEVRYVADQSIAAANTSDVQQQVKYAVSTSRWQSDKDLKTYINTKDAAIVLVTSLSDADQVQQLADQHGNDITFVFVQLTKSLTNQHVGDWLKWLFVENERNAVAGYKRLWSVSRIRSRVIENEKKLKTILGKHEKTEIV